MRDDGSSWPEALHENPPHASGADSLDLALSHTLRTRARALEEGISDIELARGRRRLQRALPAERSPFVVSALGGFVGALAAGLAGIALLTGVDRLGPAPAGEVLGTNEDSVLMKQLEAGTSSRAALVLRHDQPDELARFLAEGLAAQQAGFSLLHEDGAYLILIEPMDRTRAQAFRRWASAAPEAISNLDVESDRAFVVVLAAAD